MSGAVALSAAFLALFPSDVTRYDTQVMTSAGVVPVPPWIFVTVALPDVTERSQSRDPHLYTVRARTLVYATTPQGVRIIADKIAVEGARPVAAGWRTSAVELVNTREAIEDPDVTITTTGKHPVYGVLEFLFTAAPTA